MIDETVFAIVLNWNNESDSADCLESLLAQLDVRLEILIVDNASTDGSGERLRARYPALEYLQTEANLGYSGGNNRGIQWALARGVRWLLVVNNDTVADPDCIRLLLDAAAGDDSVAAVSPLITRFDDPTRIWFAGGRLDRARGIGVHEHENESVAALLGDRAHDAALRECSFLSGCCLLLRARAVEQVGAFRDDFFAYVEDVDLSYRLRAAKWRIGWVPGARLAHRVPPYGAPASPMQIRLRDRNRRRMVRSLYPLRWRMAFALWFWPTRLVHLARYRLAGDLPRVKALLAGIRER